jgi:hypothetical protein
MRNLNLALLPPGSATAISYGSFPGSRRMFALIGADGQFILVDPKSKLYLVQTAVLTSPADPRTEELMPLWQALVQAMGR